MGSEGRHEQTFASDQDNGIVFDPGERCPDDVREALLPLAEHINASLAACGFQLCRGEIMACNPRWCLSGPSGMMLSGTGSSWRSHAVLHSTIFSTSARFTGNGARGGTT